MSSLSKTFLTIDLDYFGMQNLLGNKIKHNKKNTINFVKQIFDLNIPYIVVKDHHEIVPFMNHTKYDKIINIDFHSDVVVDPEYDSFRFHKPLQLNEGTWGNFYRYKKDCIFEWRMPDKQICLYEGFGVCGYFQEYTIDWKPSKMGYKRVQQKEGLDKLPYDSIIKVAFCISPTWYDKKDIQYLFDSFPQLNLN